jgi:hypothetical protein
MVRKHAYIIQIKKKNGTIEQFLELPSNVESNSPELVGQLEALGLNTNYYRENCNSNTIETHNGKRIYLGNLPPNFQFDHSTYFNLNYTNEIYTLSNKLVVIDFN